MRLETFIDSIGFACAIGPYYILLLLAVQWLNSGYSLWKTHQWLREQGITHPGWFASFHRVCLIKPIHMDAIFFTSIFSSIYVTAAIVVSFIYGGEYAVRVWGHGLPILLVLLVYGLLVISLLVKYKYTLNLTYVRLVNNITSRPYI